MARGVVLGMMIVGAHARQVGVMRMGVSRFRVRPIRVLRVRVVLIVVLVCRDTREIVVRDRAGAVRTVGVLGHRVNFCVMVIRRDGRQFRIVTVNVRGRRSPGRDSPCDERLHETFEFLHPRPQVRFALEGTHLGRQFRVEKDRYRFTAFVRDRDDDRDDPEEVVEVDVPPLGTNTRLIADCVESEARVIG